ncbi:hypothetical protein [Nodosilinea sp. P-1105]|uniref:hypothetical protein n=1 Tax=Nodosilinea sp. P-1105 TaxID=2546229 RepID=UPI00146EF759|nr:hypothetical protein [Nodosilinea sp. P-1105]NMF85053.1 hypothetical protein [Nodosilinea sp. P-1105]
MQPILKPLLGGVVAVSTLLCSGLAVTASPSVEIETDPSLSEVIPFSTPTTLSLTALDSYGQSLEAVNFDLTLLTPPKTPWWTSDFPIVEGTTLFEVTLPADQGTAQLEKMMPIRGSYQLQVLVSPQVEGSFEPYTQVLTLQVPENPVKYRNVAILLSILFIVGLGGGWVIGGDQKVLPGETAPRRVQWLLSGTALVAIAVMLYVSVMAERAEAHPGGHGHSHDHGHEMVESEPLDVKPVPESIAAEIRTGAVATVGQAIPLAIAIADEGGQPIDNALLEVETWLVGYDRVMQFTAQADRDGEFGWRQQFFDGAPHRIVVNVEPVPGSEPEFVPFTLTKTIDVNAVAPPIETRMISLTYFTLFLALGTGIGYWLKRRVSLA